MTARIPINTARAMSGYLSEVEIVRRAMSGMTVNMAALEQAKAAIDRMPSKAELRMMVRSAEAACREVRNPAPRPSDDFAIPAYSGATA